MRLKVAITQAAAAGTGTQDFTDASAGFSSDVKAAIFFSSSATSTHTDTADAAFNVGFAAATGGTTQAAISSRTSDNVSASTSDYNRSASLAYTRATGANADTGNFTIDSWLSNGVRVSWGEASNSELVTALLLGGDIEATVKTATFTGGAAPDTQTVTHGLSGAPEVIIGIFLRTFEQSQSIGAWVSGVGYACRAIHSRWDGAAQQVYGWADTTGILAYLQTSTPAWTATISNVGATTFDVVSDATTTADPMYFLCLRGTTTPLTAAVGIDDTPTSTGTNVLVSGMSAAPRAALLFPSRQTATGRVSGTAGAAFDLNAICNRLGTMQYGGISTGQVDNVAPTQARAQVTDSQAMRILNAADPPVADVEATVYSWDSGGVTLNYSNVGASAFQVPYLAFGIQSTKYLKLLADSSAASATGVEVVVYSAPGGSNYVTGTTRYGSTNGQEFEASLESGSAVLKVLASDVDCNDLAASTTVAALARNTTYTTGMVEATIIEE